ncbi:stripe [Anopheles darlingi]|uniref:Stripe n=1 Tax=Anopheles darlingi TaxID=43151 RepID=W5JFF2_ANODA|nr:stripe [Anopheles darlingi]
MRKYSNAGGTKAKDTASNRKQDANELDLGVASSPSRANGTGRRTKKQTKQQKELKSSDAKDKQTNTTINATPPVENKNITPLPGFQQAFGSTEIGKFSEAFFNSSPTPNDTSTPEHHHHPLHHHHHHHLSEQQQHQQQQPTPQQQQQLQLLHHSQRTATPQQQAHHQLSGGTVEQLLMDSLHTYESDVDTLSPQQQQQQQQQSWDHAVAPGTTMASLDRLSSYESCHNGASISSSAAAAAAAAAGYNLQIGTSFHPSYYESSSYSSDHAVDSPLGSYFSEMTCNEFVN